MNRFFKKLAALVLAVAMMAAFTPLYGAGSFAYADDDPFAGVYMTDLEGPWAVFDDGTATFRLTDSAALEVEGVTRYEAFVGVAESWEALNPACYRYDEATQTVTVDGSVIANMYPDYLVEKRLNVQIKGLGNETSESNPEGIKMLASKMDINFWPAYSQYDLPEDRTVLPGWDGTFDGTIRTYFENSEYPDGIEIPLNVEDVEVVEGRELLEDWHPDSDGDNHWWYYRTGRDMGTVTFKITYRDVDGSSKTHDMHLSISEDVYEVALYSEGDVDILLPDSDLTLHAWGSHKHWNGEYEEYTEEDLDFDWSLVRNDADAAEINRNEADHTTAMLRIRRPEEGEDLVAGLRVKVAVSDKNAPGEEKASAILWAEVNSDFYDIRPAGLDQFIGIGQSITQDFTVHHFSYNDGMSRDDIVPITKAKWYFDSNALEILRDGQPVRPEEDLDGGGTFTIKRLSDWNTDARIQVWFNEESGNERDINRGYWFRNRDYGLWFENHDLDVFTNTQEDPQFRLNTGSFGGGNEADEYFNFTFTAGEWNGEDWIKTLPDSAIHTVREGDDIIVTVDRNEIGLDGYKDIRIVAKAESKTTDWSIENDAWIHVKKAKYDFNLEEHMDMLPGWDRNLDEFEVYIENSDYPEGEDFHFEVTNVEVVSGAEHLEEVPSADNGWYFRAGNYGQVVFDLTYIDEKGSEKHYQVEVNISGDVYECEMFWEGPLDHALPGGSLELHADAWHKYVDERGGYHEDQENLVYDWGFEFGGEYADLIKDSNDPTHATLRFKDMPAGLDWMNGDVGVVIRIKDARNQPGVVRNSQTRNFWVSSEFTELQPTEPEGIVNIGKSTGDIHFEVLHYSVFGKAEDGYVDNCKRFSIDRMQVFFNEDDLGITANGGNQVHDGDVVNGDSLDFFRKQAYGLGADIRAWFVNDFGHTEDIGITFLFSDLNYDLWFDRDEESLYDDGEWTVELRKNDDLDYSDLDIRISAGYYDWDGTSQEGVWHDAPADCWKLNKDGKSVTVFGAAAAEHGLEEIRVRAEAWYGEERIGEAAECTLHMNESCISHGEEHMWLTFPAEYPDCLSEGTQRMMCWNCFERKIVVVPPRGHVTKVVKAKASTAKAEGNIKYWKCIHCDKCFTDAACKKEISEDATKIPKGLALTKVTAQKKGFTAAWKAPAGAYLSHTEGYEIMYAQNSKFTSGKKTVKVTKAKTATKKVTGLKAKKKYFVRIRAYRTIAGKKYYSPWSKAKSVTTKK